MLNLAATDLVGRSRRCRLPNSDARSQVSFVVISRACFNAKTYPDDPVRVALPAEDPDSCKGLCGHLQRHMRGAQKAAEGWQMEYSQTLIDLGFQQGFACPCILHQTTRDIVCTVLGDDFSAVGPKRLLDWYEKSLESRYELKKGGRLGPGANVSYVGVATVWSTKPTLCKPIITLRTLNLRARESRPWRLPE